MNEVGELLKNIYAMELHECNDTVLSYLLINKLQYLDPETCERSDDTNYRTAILLIILSVIFMNGGSILAGKLLRIIFWVS